jgi:hypothetical protein
LALATALAGLGLATVTVPQASAAVISCGGPGQPPCPPLSTTGGSTATINVAPAIRSISVSPSTTTFDTCHSTLNASLTFPNDACYTTGADDVTITNGALAGHVDVNGADAVPHDSGQHWTLCGGSGPSCTGAAPGGGGGCLGQCITNEPGIDQFVEWGGAGPYTPFLTNSPQGDTVFGALGSAAVGQSATEGLEFIGPSSSTDLSSTFTTAWTWTAVP